MIRILTTIVALFMHFICYADIQDDSHWLRLSSEIREMRLQLAKNGAYAFVMTTSATAKTPHIHSQYWLMLIPETNIALRQYEQEKRDFGLDMIGQLEQYAKQKIDIKNISALEQRVHELLAIANWLKKESGYGNFILKRWAEDMASTTISELAVNNDFPVSDAWSLLRRIDTPQANAKMQISILNEESPDHYDIPKGDTAERLVREIGNQWSSRKVSAVQTLKKKYAQKTVPQFSEAFPHDPRLAFYMKDINRVNASLRALWNDKDHEEVCVYGMFCKVPQMVEHILEFREAAGSIPVPTDSDLKDLERQELFVDKINDIWLSNYREKVSKPVGRLVLWVYTGMLNDTYSRVL